MALVVVVAAAVLSVSAGSIYLNYRLGLDPIGPQSGNDPVVGDCLILEEVERDGELWVNPTPADCEDAKTYSYLVTAVLAPPLECEPDDMYYESLIALTQEVSERTCLVPSFAQAACYDVIDDYTLLYEVARCPQADFEVAHVAHSASWECAAGQETLRFPKANRTFCLAWR